MGSLFREALRLRKNDPTLTEEQHRWIQLRNRCDFDPDRLQECILEVTKARISQLGRIIAATPVQNGASGKLGRPNFSETSAQHSGKIDPIRLAQRRGYKAISFQDFKLDAKTLAVRSEKIALIGLYARLHEVDQIFPSLLAFRFAVERPNIDSGIGLLADGATRDVRKYLLECQGNPVTASVGCPIMVLGHVENCANITLFGAQKTPCVVVEGRILLNK
jgi:hypothetical protein